MSTQCFEIPNKVPLTPKKDRIVLENEKNISCFSLEAIFEEYKLLKMKILIFLTCTVFCQTIIGQSFKFGFEDVYDLKDIGFKFEEDVPNWHTTASDQMIEVWMNKPNLTQASEGECFVELNASENAALFIDVDVKDFDKLRLSFDHRARLFGGEDIMEVFVGDPSAILESIGLYTSDNFQWYTFEEEVSILPNQTMMRIRFEAISTVSGDPTVGNFLDNIQITRLENDFSTNEIASSFNVYPNPVVDFLTVDISDEKQKYRIQIQNEEGKIVLNKSISDRAEIHVEPFPSGVYSVTLLNAKGKAVETTSFFRI